MGLYPHILATATDNPTRRVTTSEMLEAFGERISPSLRQSILHLGIEERHSIIENFLEFILGKENRVLSTDTTRLATEAIRKSLLQYPVEKEKIGLLVTITNSANRMMPATSFEVIAELGESIPHNINSLNMQNQGCSALLKAFEIAGYYLQANPGKVALVVSTDAHTGFSSPHPKPMYYGFGEIKKLRLGEEAIYDTQSLLEAFLFGDGAIAFLLGDDECKPRVGPFTHLTNIDKGDLEILKVDEGGVLHPNFSHYCPDYRMSAGVPDRGALYAGMCVRELFGREESKIRALSEVDYGLIHTGSKKILDGVCKILEVDPADSKIQISYEILKRYGNISPSAIGFMIAELLKQKARGKALLVSFGAGFSASAGVLDLKAAA